MRCCWRTWRWSCGAPHRPTPSERHRHRGRSRCQTNLQNSLKIDFISSLSQSHLFKLASLLQKHSSSPSASRCAFSLFNLDFRVSQGLRTRSPCNKQRSRINSTELNRGEEDSGRTNTTQNKKNKKGRSDGETRGCKSIDDPFKVWADASTPSCCHRRAERKRRKARGTLAPRSVFLSPFPTPSDANEAVSCSETSKIEALEGREAGGNWCKRVWKIKGDFLPVDTTKPRKTKEKEISRRRKREKERSVEIGLLTLPSSVP